MLTDNIVIMTKSAIIASTAEGYDILFSLRDPNNRRHLHLYKNVTAATMRRYYRLVDKTAGRPCVNITRHKEIINAYSRPANWQKKFLY